MRKLMMVMALVVVMVPLLVGAAFAYQQVIQCKSKPCYGSGNDDLIYERIGNGKDDKIYARGGHDRILANKYTNDHDIIKGGKGGFDKINVRDGDPKDRIRAGAGAHDWCIVDANSVLGGGCERIN